ncbi:MAG: TonB system transport protein ExbD [Campylobacteraceae bacterium]|jgi:biopolymer transport protein ExbD|nr:TonB system transport protein ExbD [Campylobacteraceae bacterium]
MAKIKKFDSINVVPFIDVMLVLLTIVLTVATFVAQGLIPVDLPKGSTKQEIKLKSIEIVIKEDGKIYYQNEFVDKNTMRQKLASVNKNDQIIVKSDKNSKFQSFVDVIDALKERNIEKISIVTTVNEK